MLGAKARKLIILAFCVAMLMMVPHQVQAEDKEASSKARPMPPFISPAGKPYRSGDEEPYAKDQWFHAVDADGDSALTAVEFRGEAEMFFDELDTDRDGRIGPAEMVNYEKVVAPEVQVGFGPPTGMDSMPRQGMRPPGGMGPPPGGGFPDGGPPPSMGKGGPSNAMKKKMAKMPQGAARFAILGMPQPVAAADVNMNGSVTLEEMQSAAVERFGWLDDLGNKDGKLTWDELPEAPAEDLMNLNKRNKKKKKDKDKDK
jgi:EF hand